MLAPIRWIIALVSALVGLITGPKEEPRTASLPNPPAAAAPLATASPAAIPLGAQRPLMTVGMLQQRDGAWVSPLPPRVPGEARILRIERAGRPARGHG